MTSAGTSYWRTGQGRINLLEMNLDASSDDLHLDDGSDFAEERDLLVVLRLSNRQMGSAAERAEISLMADEFSRAVEAASVGEYDGDEYGGGECILFFCGPDEDALLGLLRPLLQRSAYARGAHFVRLVKSEDGEMKREKIPV